MEDNLFTSPKDFGLVKILTSQLTIRIGLLPVSAWPSHDGKEGDGVKS
jgi:hypothetical protein